MVGDAAVAAPSFPQAGKVGWPTAITVLLTVSLIPCYRDYVHDNFFEAPEAIK